MTVRVLFFALAKQQIGEASVAIEVAPNATIGDVRRSLMEQFPAAKLVLEKSFFAQNDKYVLDESLLDPTAELACIPPVSGG